MKCYNLNKYNLNFNAMIYQTELCILADENGQLTQDGKFLIEMVFRCLNVINGVSEWDRMMENPDQKKELEEAFERELN